MSETVTIECSSRGVPIEVSTGTLMKVLNWVDGKNWRRLNTVNVSHSTEIDGYTVVGENMHPGWLELDGEPYYTGEDIEISLRKEGDDKDSEEFGLLSREELIDILRESGI